MKVLVTGANGQLGYDVIKALQKQKIECFGATRNDFDITDSKATENFIRKYMPDVVIHCAAYTAVDKAEDEQDLCYKVNTSATEGIAEICKKINAKMLYISTDYVFDGNKDGIYEINDQTNPLSVYGKTKLLGEGFVKSSLSKYFIVRISWVFGINGNNFIKTMLRLANEGKKELNVVNDQIGSPTYTADLAVLLCDMIETEKYGTYHATNEGYCSWYDFAKKIFELANKDIVVNPVNTEEYLKLVKQQAKRPMNSKMSKLSLVKAGFNRLPSWENALERYLKELI